MSCGMFGKMPSKRDFVALNAPRSFLNPFETWLQSGVASSKETLGAHWQEKFLHAPIWRFWLGRGICENSVSGVLMPSVDGVGRYFPLCVFAVSSEDEEILPPVMDTMEGWYGRAEDLLLETLEEGFSDKPNDLLSRLGMPTFVRPNSHSFVAKNIPGGISVSPLQDDNLDGLFAALYESDLLSFYASRSYWWTAGGANLGPRTMVFEGMPDPSVFSTFLDQNTSDETTR